VAQCTVLYPGLLGPDVPLEELPRNDWPDKRQLPNLSLVLNRGKVEAVTRQSLEQQILTSLGYTITAGDELPVAGLRMNSEITGDATLWCLDPVHVQLDREMAYLAADDLALTEEEARQFIASLNQHFADEFQIHYHSPHQWLVQIDLQVSTRTPSESALQDISRMMPAGEDATRWRSLANEIQMLLHNHPANTARQQAGKLPVNSVWLWGGGVLKTDKSEVDVVYARDELASIAAGQNQIAYEELPSQFDAGLFEGRNTLLVLTDQLSALQQKDVYAWLAGLIKMEQTVLAPLLAFMKDGKLERLVLLSDSLCLTITKQDLRKWWRRNKSVEANILALRKTYDYRN